MKKHQFILILMTLVNLSWLLFAIAVYVKVNPNNLPLCFHTAVIRINEYRPIEYIDMEISKEKVSSHCNEICIFLVPQTRQASFDKADAKSVHSGKFPLLIIPQSAVPDIDCNAWWSTWVELCFSWHSAQYNALGWEMVCVLFWRLNMACWWTSVAWSWRERPSVFGGNRSWRK